MLVWAIRIIALWSAIGTVGYLLLDEWTSGAANTATPLQEESSSAPSAPGGNSQTFRADTSGHYFLTAVVNGASVHFLVDTGATLVTLSLKDAEAAGLDPRRLAYTKHSQTANGIARFAPVTLRELRIGQATFRDVEAAVMERPLHVSLLGMSLLGRLDGYEIRDSKLTMRW